MLPFWHNSVVGFMYLWYILTQPSIVGLFALGYDRKGRIVPLDTYSNGCRMSMVGCDRIGQNKKADVGRETGHLRP